MQVLSANLIELLSALNAKYLNELFLNIIGVFLDRIAEFFHLYLVQLLCGFFECDGDVFAEESPRGLMYNPYTCCILYVIDHNGTVIQRHLMEGRGILVWVRGELLVLTMLRVACCPRGRGVCAVTIHILRSLIVFLLVNLRSNQRDTDTDDGFQRQVSN